MKKYNLILCAFTLLFAACKHEPVIPDMEYFNEDTGKKVSEFLGGFETGSHDVLNIGLRRDTSGNNQVSWRAHINNRERILDAIQVDKSSWITLPDHFGEGVATTSLSSDNDQIVAFQIRSNTTPIEVMKGEVMVQKSTPITATDLGNNTFKINWTAQKKGQKVLINLFSLHAYTPFFDGSFAVETEDDGEYIIKTSVFERIKQVRFAINPNGKIEPMNVSLMRANPKRKTVVTLPSTGTQYTVFGGGSAQTTINVLTIQ
jgi:hypothetical protein